jgi:hypothetical protein
MGTMLLVWECISHLETISLKILALTADGASCSSRCMDYTRQQTSMLMKIVQSTSSIEDYTRNCWANSFSHSYSRTLWVNRQVSVVKSGYIVTFRTMGSMFPEGLLKSFMN